MYSVFSKNFLLFASSCTSPLDSFSTKTFPRPPSSLHSAPLAGATLNNPLHPAHVPPRLSQHFVLDHLADIDPTPGRHFRFKLHAFATELLVPHLSGLLSHMGLRSWYQFSCAHPTSKRPYQFYLTGTFNLEYCTPMLLSTKFVPKTCAIQLQ